MLVERNEEDIPLIIEYKEAICQTSAVALESAEKPVAWQMLRMWTQPCTCSLAERMSMLLTRPEALHFTTRSNRAVKPWHVFFWHMDPT